MSGPATCAVNTANAAATDQSIVTLSWYKAARADARAVLRCSSQLSVLLSFFVGKPPTPQISSVAVEVSRGAASENC